MEVNSAALGLFITKTCASYDVIKELFYCSETEFQLCSFVSNHTQKYYKCWSNVILCTVVSLSVLKVL